MMGIFARLAMIVGLSACIETPTADSAVIVRLKLSDDAYGASGESYGLYEVEDAVAQAIESAGTLDGHEIGGGYFTIFTYGPDPERLYAAIQSGLNSRDQLPSGSYVEIRNAAGDVRRVELRP